MILTDVMFRYFYKTIICHLVDAWSRPEVSDRLKTHLMLFVPGVSCYLPIFML